MKSMKSAHAKTAKEKTPASRWVLFRFEGAAGRDVRLAGSFNKWDHTAHPMKRAKGEDAYTLRLRLPPGRYEYKFWVDGEWLTDPAAAAQTPNAFGGMNSVIEVL